MATKAFIARNGIISGNNDLVANSGKVGVNTASPSYTLDVIATDGMRLPVGNTAQRPTGASGVIRYNSQTGAFEGYTGSSWGSLASADVSNLNASNLLTGTVPPARLPAATTSTIGGVTLVDSVVNTATASYAAAPNSVKTAYDAAIAANTRAASAQSAVTSLSSTVDATYATNTYVNGTFFKLSGGHQTIYGNTVPSTNAVFFGNTTARWVINGNTGDFSGTVLTGGGFFPYSNSSGYALGALTQRFSLFANTITASGLITSESGIAPSSNTVGQTAGSSTARFYLYANTIDCSGGAVFGGTVNTAQILTSTGVAPLANNTGSSLGGASSRWNLYANVVDVSGFLLISGAGAGIYPSSNTVGNLLGGSGNRFLVYANTIYASGEVISANAVVPTSNTVGNLLGYGTNRWQLWSSDIFNSGNATIASDAYIGGSMTANGRIFTNTGMAPASNTTGTELGLLVARWNVYANTGNFSGSISSGSIAVMGDITATGEITAYYSDLRLKKDIRLIPNALEKLASLRGVLYRPNKTALKHGFVDQENVGVIAQEIEKVLPQAVKPAPFDETYKTVQYEKLVPLLIEAIKDLKYQVNELQLRIGELAGR